MWTSTERSVTKRSLTNESSPWAASTICCRVNTQPGRLARDRQDPELRGRELHRLAADVDLMSAGVDGEVLDVDGRLVVRGLGPRRKTAWIRAASTRGLNGLVT